MTLYLTTKEFENSKILYASKKRTTIPVLYRKDEETITDFGLHTCEFYLPFGCSKSNFGFGDFTDYYITGALQNYQSDRKVQRFIKCIENLENSLIEHMMKNYSEYFSDEHQNLPEKVSGMLTTTIKHANKQYPPNISVGIPRNPKSGVFNCDIYDQDDKAEKLSDDNILQILDKNITVKCVIKCVGAWFRDAKKGGKPPAFGLKWELVQAKTFSKKKGNVHEDEPEIDSDPKDKVVNYSILSDED